jgi:hypothetical protein
MLMFGSESTTFSQQEIKGQSVRQLVMQKLIGAKGGLRESKVLCLKNVGSEQIDKQLQEEIEQECSKYRENVSRYQERQ